MQDKAEHVIKAATGFSYGLSGTLYAADILDVLNHYAGDFPVIDTDLTLQVLLGLLGLGGLRSFEKLKGVARK